MSFKKLLHLHAMIKRKLRYQFLSLSLLLAILPSIIGVHVFKHFCNGCSHNDIVATFITTEHTHSHDCADCSCNEECHDYQDELGLRAHHDENSCDHQFKRMSIEGQIADVSFKFKAADIDLYDFTNLHVDLQCDNSLQKKWLFHIIRKVPDKPLPETNCVFLL